MRDRRERTIDSGPSTTVRTVAVLGAISFLVLGSWAFVAPRSFADTVATFEPYNRHLLHDLGAFQFGLGVVLVLAAFPQRIDGTAAALLGVGVGSVLHVVSHVLDRALGGSPVSDISSLSLLAVALLAAGVARQRRWSRLRPHTAEPTGAARGRRSPGRARQAQAGGQSS